MRDIGILDVNSVTGKITFNFNKGEAQVRGRKALIQLITLNLLNDKGSNAYNSNKGTTVPSILNGTYTEGEEDVVKTMLSITINELEQQIIREQGSISFSKDELDGKLKKLEIFSIEYSASEAAWLVKIVATTAANNIGIISL